MVRTIILSLLLIVVPARISLASSDDFPILKNLEYLSSTATGKGLIRGNYLYILGPDYGPLYIYDIKNPRVPVRLSTTNLNLAWAEDFEIVGNRAYVTGGETTDGEIFRITTDIYDLSNPISPTRIGHNAFEQDDVGLRIITDGRAAYIVGYDCIIRQDVSNPQAVKTVGIDYDVYKDIDSCAGYLYGSAGGLYIYDTRTTESLEFEKATPNYGARKLTIDGKNAYAACNDTGDLKIFNLDDPLSPSLISSSKIIYKSVSDIAYGNKLVYMAHDNCRMGLDVYDASDLNHVALVAEMQFLPINGRYGAVDMKVDVSSGLIYCGGYLLRHDMHDTLRVSNVNRTGYQANFLNRKNFLYSDRELEFVTPSPQAMFTNQTYIQTRNDDKKSTGDAFLTFNIDRSATVYVAYDERAASPPAWLAKWSKTSICLTTTDSNGPTRRLYSRRFPAGTVTLGGNRDASTPATNDISMYTILLDSSRNAVTDWAIYN